MNRNVRNAMKELDAKFGRESEADVDWLADQYVAGELSDHDAIAFEDRLALEQSAREALARSVELFQAITLSGESCISPVRSAINQPTMRMRDSLWLKPAGWLAASAAAVLVMGVTLKFLWSPISSGGLESSLLASEWTEFRDLTEDAFGDPASRNELTESGWDGLAATTAVEDLGESNWLLTALAPSAELPGENKVHQQ
jgi:hypothetical protein